MVTQRQSKQKKAKDLKANNSSKSHRLHSSEEAISKISPIPLRLLKTNLNNLIELQSKKSLSLNFLLNSIVMDFFKTNKESKPLMTHY